MGEILADALPAFERDVDRRVDLGRARDVVEVLVDAVVELVQELQRVVAAGHVQVVGQLVEQGGGGGELGREEEFPVVALVDHVVEIGPGIGREEGRDADGGLDLDEGLGDDDELAVLAGDVEVMDGVGEVVAVGEGAAPRRDGQVEGEAALLRVRARVHARFHHGFGDGLVVQELGEVADGVEDGGLLACEKQIPFGNDKGKGYPASAAWML